MEEGCVTVIHPYLFVCPQELDIVKMKREMDKYNRAPYASGYLASIAILLTGIFSHCISSLGILTAGHDTGGSCLVDGVTTLMTTTGASCVEFDDELESAIKKYDTFKNTDWFVRSHVNN